MGPEETATFLKECEEKFANRYTKKDTEYARVSKTLTTGCVPPLIVYKPSYEFCCDDDSNEFQPQHHVQSQTQQDMINTDLGPYGDQS